MKQALWVLGDRQVSWKVWRPSSELQPRWASDEVEGAGGVGRVGGLLLGGRGPPPATEGSKRPPRTTKHTPAYEHQDTLVVQIAVQVPRGGRPLCALEGPSVGQTALV